MVRSELLTQVDWFVLAFFAHSPGPIGAPGENAEAPGGQFLLGTRLRAPWSPWRMLNRHERVYSLTKLMRHGYLEPQKGGFYAATKSGVEALLARQERLYTHYVEYGTRRRKMPSLAFAYIIPENAPKTWKRCDWPTSPTRGQP